MILKSFCLGCRYEKADKGHEPCSTVCEARVYYVRMVEDPEYKLPDQFLRGNDMITKKELAESIAHPRRYRKKLAATNELVSPRPKGFMARSALRPAKYVHNLNREGAVEEGYKYCPDCLMADNPRPLSAFYKNSGGFRGRQGRCKKHHMARYRRPKKKDTI